MKGIGNLLLNIAVALYLFANGVLGFDKKGEFFSMANAIFERDLANVVAIVLSVFAIAAGVFLLLQLFKIEIGITDLILFIFVIVWVVFIVIIDIYNPIFGKGKTDFLPYLVQLSAHLMVLGALVSSTKRFG